jgi:hypothetical protein
MARPPTPLGKIARRLLLVLCCAAAASGHATAPHTTLRKARRLMSTPSLDQHLAGLRAAFYSF